MRRFIFGLLVPLVVAGCGVLPSAGPISLEVVAGASNGAPFSYEIIDVEESVVYKLSQFPRASLVRKFGPARPRPREYIGIGDTVVVTIFESAPGGLFSAPAVAGSTGSRSVSLPPQTVDRDGSISVPYAGRIKAAGLPTSAVADVIVRRLAGKAIEPQAIVALSDSTSRSATVAGDVTGGGRVNLNIKGDRLLEVISQAGGIKALPHETFIRLSRYSSTVTVRLSDILDSPQENIFIYPGDTIYVFKEPQTFTALGAVGAQSDIQIDRSNMRLSDAIGKAGGLSDLLADSSSIFLFRWEEPDIVRQLRPGSPLLDGNKFVPVIYRLSFRDPRGYFWARVFQVQNKDIVYVANAPTVELMKFMNVVRSIATTVRTIQSSDVLIAQ